MKRFKYLPRVFLPLFCALLLATVLNVSGVIPSQRHTAYADDSWSGTAGSLFTINGTGWTSGDEIQVYWDDGTLLSDVTVQSDDSFTATFNIPSSANPGDHQVTIADVTDSSLTAFATFTVIPSPDFSGPSSSDQSAQLQDKLSPLKQWFTLDTINHLVDAISLAEDAIGCANAWGNAVEESSGGITTLYVILSDAEARSCGLAVLSRVGNTIEALGVVIEVNGIQLEEYLSNGIPPGFTP